MKSPSNDKWERTRPDTEFKAISLAIQKNTPGSHAMMEKMLSGYSYGMKWSGTFKTIAELPSFDDIMKGIFKFLLGQMHETMKGLKHQ